MNGDRKLDTHGRLAVAAALLVTAVAAVYGLLSTGTYYDDDIAHYLIARYAWKHPGLFMQTWGRPAFTILYAPAAALGFGAVRCFSAVLAGGVCFMAARLAKLYGVRWYWLAALLTGFQPEVLKLAFSCLTELTFMFILCGALIAYRRQKWTWMAFAAGWLPMARYESAPLLLVFAIILLWRRKPAALAWLAAPLLIHNIYHAVELKTATALLFPLDQALGIRPGVSPWDLPYGKPLYYVGLMPRAYGWIVLLLALAAAFTSPFNLLDLCVVITVAVVCILHAWFPTAGIPTGYTRYLSPAAPAFGVLAALGLEKLVTRVKKREFAIALPIGLAAAVAAITLLQVRPFAITPEREAVNSAAQWFVESPYHDRLVIGAHTCFTFAADLDRFDDRVFQMITPANIEAAPKGAVVVWDSHYSHRLRYRTPLNKLTDDPRFRELKSWQSGGFRIIAFEKVAL